MPESETRSRLAFRFSHFRPNYQLRTPFSCPNVQLRDLMFNRVSALQLFSVSISVTSIFRLGNRLRYARIGSDSPSRELPIASDSPGQPPNGSEPTQACPSSSEAFRAETDVFKFDR